VNQKKMSLWWRGVFAGGFGVFGCFVVVNRGEVVVDCVVNRGAWQTLFAHQKIRQLLKIFFFARPVLARGFDEPYAASAL
jgi:hypothetical protein